MISCTEMGGPRLVYCFSPQAPLQNLKGLLNIATKPLIDSLLKILLTLKVPDSEMLSSCLKYLCSKCGPEANSIASPGDRVVKIPKALQSACLSPALSAPRSLAGCPWSEALFPCLFSFPPLEFPS